VRFDEPQVNNKCVNMYKTGIWFSTSTATAQFTEIATSADRENSLI
jgi:hypothetical protein